MIHIRRNKDENLNLIQKQADDFIRKSETPNQYNYQDYIGDVRLALYDYHKDVYKIQFVEHLILRFKQSYDDHLEKCTYKPKQDCPENIIHENILFFLQEELEELEGNLDDRYFNQSYRNSLTESMDEILSRFNKLEMGQQITYDDLFNELQELKSFYYLNKKNWIEMFAGKLSGMIAGGVISETVSKEIVEVIKDNYPDLIG